MVKAILKRFGAKLRFVFRNMPLSEMHPNAELAAEAAEAAAAQGKFWQMHDALYEHQDEPKSGSLGCAVEVNSLIPNLWLRENILSGKPDKASRRVLWEKTPQGPRVGPN
jgi:Thioredoxin